jgi:hypothetical protein
MAEDPDKALKDRLGAALGKLTDTLTAAQQAALDATRGLAQAQLDTEAAQPTAVPPAVTNTPDSF